MFKESYLNTNRQEPLYPQPDRIQWARGVYDVFVNIMQSNEVRKVLSNFVAVGVLPDQSSIDSATSLLTRVMVTAAKQAGMLVKKGAVPRRQAHQELGFQKPQVKHPMWYNMSCRQAYSAVKATAALLRSDPRNAWLRGKLCSESKVYKRVVKASQKTYVDGIYKDLELINRSDPKGYMDLVKTLKEGTFDKKMPSDTEGIAPDAWLNHFKDLLGKAKAPTVKDHEMEEYILKNIDAFQTELDQPFTHDELKRSLKALKNNKASGFDLVCNEMLKSCGSAMENALLTVYKTCLSHGLIASEWRKDQLRPLFKSGIKSDPNNFRGICVSSCVGKTLNSMLRYRLEGFCKVNCLLGAEQASGQTGARTSDHLLVLHHLIQKYVKNNKKVLYVCYVDLRKAYDSCNRTKLFYEL